MSIPASIKIKDCVGKRATLDRDIMNGAGQCVPKGTVVQIVGTGRSLHIKTLPCPCCGQYAYIRDVGKHSLTLVEDN